MSKKIIAVMGSTGHVGHIIADDLLKRGHVIRAIGRNEKKLRTLLGKGAEIFLYDFDDVEGLTEAFKDCYSVFVMVPPNVKEDLNSFQDRVITAICKALQNTCVERVVSLSSLGADLDKGTGPILGLRRLEEKLNALETITDLTHIRAGYFMENLTSSIPTILYQSEINTPLNGDIPIPMIATRDIGWKAADLLERTDPVGHGVLDFVGPHNVTFDDVTHILGKAFDKPDLRYVQISFEDERDKMLKAGIHPTAADALIEMLKAFNEGKIKPTQKLTAEHHGTTTFEEFAQMFAHRMLTAAWR